ncbi:lysozyme C-1-like [Engystomops pustulosus]|uniref:lysozyme C-1-like n=1 Tax=Engystomops pustulosus TaxID=76066 RepID=UPI003AFB3B5D
MHRCLSSDSERRISFCIGSHQTFLQTMRGLLCLLLLCLVYGANAKCFEDCELYELLKKELDESSAAQWVCLARELTKSCTGNIYRGNGKLHYGIFKIGADWCNNKGGNRKKYCGTSCANLINDNLDGDIRCLKYIIRSTGIRNWDMWNTKCDRGDFNRYIKDCKST